MAPPARDCTPLTAAPMAAVAPCPRPRRLGRLSPCHARAGKTRIDTTAGGGRRGDTASCFRRNTPRRGNIDTPAYPAARRAMMH